MIYGCRRMIYLLRKCDITSVPFIREAYIICEADIIPAGYITRSGGTDIIEKRQVSVETCRFLSMDYEKDIFRCFAYDFELSQFE
jgi:hypothetical protein